MAFLKLKLNPTLDAFATRRNALLPRFISPSADNFAEEINGLKHPRDKEVFFSHTPIAIIEKCIQKIQEEYIIVILVLPNWEQCTQIRTLVQVQQWKLSQTKLHKPLEMIYVITKPRSSNLTHDQVNLLTDHAYGSRVVDDYDYRPDKPLSIVSFEEWLYSDSRVVKVLQNSPNNVHELQNRVGL
ncbi:MAG: hypothetical protein EZS28_014241 [Streblomastix strix]|uniref:Uncharacterized protein n=1 Tax=Streblomastix strix TaxID=222440 RepID=A0A5J4W6C4_9EUKA|nr:MAG: hypothetical protein EZS28_014241 [Streblomastix strix]